MLHTMTAELLEAAYYSDNVTDMWFALRHAIRNLELMDEPAADAVWAYRDEFDTWELACDDDNPLPMPNPASVVEILYGCDGWASYTPREDTSPDEYSLEWNMYSSIPDTMRARTHYHMPHILVYDARVWTLSTDGLTWRHWPLKPEYQR